MEESTLTMKYIICSHPKFEKLGSWSKQIELGQPGENQLFGFTLAQTCHVCMIFNKNRDTVKHELIFREYRSWFGEIKLRVPLTNDF